MTKVLKLISKGLFIIRILRVIQNISDIVGDHQSVTWTSLHLNYDFNALGSKIRPLIIVLI